MNKPSLKISEIKMFKLINRNLTFVFLSSMLFEACLSLNTQCHKSQEVTSKLTFINMTAFP